MKNELKKFDYESREIRTVTNDDMSFFVAKDVCEILGLDNVSRAMSRLDEDEKLTLPLVISGQKRDTWVTNESGLYHLILTSEKPEAKAFRKWITSEVLPSIRKDGKYTNETIKNRELELQKLMNEVETIDQEITSYKSKITELKDIKDKKYLKIKQIIKTDPDQTNIAFPE